MAQSEQRCSWCLKRCGKLRCRGCGTALYCSRDPCQKRHWVDSHKRLCGQMNSGLAKTTVLEEWFRGILLWFRAIHVTRSGDDILLAVEHFRRTLLLFSSPAFSKDEIGRCFLFVGLCFSDKGELLVAKEYLLTSFYLKPSLEASVEINLLMEESGEYNEAREFARENVLPQSIENLEWVNAWQRPGFFSKHLRSKPFWSESEFSWVSTLEQNFTVIKSELAQLLTSNKDWPDVGGSHRESGSDDSSVVASGKWTEIVLFGRGADTSVCPRTCQLLKQSMPEAIDLCDKMAGEIIFSRLSPKTKILPHCAATNHRLTAHLGLIVPAENQEKCQIQVGGTWKSWKEGKVLLFDDSFEHQVQNNTNFERVVLLIRFWHPDLSEDERGRHLSAAIKKRSGLLHLRSFPPMGANDKVTRCGKCSGDEFQIDMASLEKKVWKVRCLQCHHVSDPSVLEF